MDLIERVGVLPELRRDLHHDMVLVERRVHRRHLPLAEGIVQRVVDRLLRKTQARRGVAIDDDVGLEAAVLLIAADVGENFNGAQFLEHLRRPLVQLAEVVALQRELILRVARSAADAQILNRLQVEIDAGDVRDLLADASDNEVGVDLSHAQGFERDVHVRRIGCALGAGERDDVGDRRIFTYRRDQFLQPLLHRLE